MVRTRPSQEAIDAAARTLASKAIREYAERGKRTENLTQCSQPIDGQTSARLADVLVRLMDAAIRLGYTEFEDAAKYILLRIQTELGTDAEKGVTIDHLQAAYVFAATAHPDKRVTPKAAVIACANKPGLK